MKFRVIPKLLVGLPGNALLVATVAAQEATDTHKVSDIALLSQIINWTGIFEALLIIFVAWAIMRFVDRVVEDLGRSMAERRLTFQRFNAFFHFFVYILTVVIIVIVSFDFRPEVIALFGGGAVVAFGFATRDLLASLVAGVLIIFDKPFQLGDRVSFGGQYGDVLSIGLRSVKIRTLDDCTVTIPNNLFLSEVSSSSNSGLLEMQTVVHFYIGMDQDLQQALALVHEATAISRYVYLPNPIAVQAWQQPLDGCIAMQLQLKAYVLDTKYEKDFQTDVVVRVHQAFQEANIMPPVCLQQRLEYAPAR